MGVDADTNTIVAAQLKTENENEHEVLRGKELLLLPSPLRRSLRDIVYVICKRRWQVLWPLLAVLAVALLLSFATTPLFRSEASLLLKPSPQVNASAGQPSVSTEQVVRNQAEMEISILSSRPVLEQAVAGATLRGSNNTALDDAAIAELRDGLSFHIQARQRLLNITLAHSDRALVQSQLEALLTAYQERRDELYQTSVVPAGLDEKLVELQRDMNDKEKRLRDAQVGGDEVVIAARLRRLTNQGAELDTDTAAADVQIDAALARVRSLQQSLSEQPADDRQSTERAEAANLEAELTKQLVELRLKESNLQAFYPDDFRPLIDVRRQIEIVQQALEQTQPSVELPPLQLALDTEQAALEALRARQQSLRGQRSAVAEELAVLTEQQQLLRQLQRQFTLAEGEYLTLKSSLQRSEIAVELSAGVGSTALLQPPTPVAAPASAGSLFKILIIGSGLVGGLLAGTALAFLRERFDETLQRQSDVQQKLGLPVLASFTAQELRQCT